MSDSESRHLVTRRQTLGALAVAGAGAALAGTRGLLPGGVADSDAETTAKPSCILTPEEEEGPYYVDLEKVRSNIVAGREGVPLNLTIRVVDSRSCGAIHNAAIDIWHCDAVGVYSAESSEGTTSQTWLRGVQLTDRQGIAEFKTIYPGHYQGRAVHIHMKVHIGGSVSGTTYSGGHVSHTGQMFVPDKTSLMVYELAPYDQNEVAFTTHTEDRVWTQQHGNECKLTLHKLGTSVKNGFRGTITVGVNPRSTPDPVGV